jgi:hypothetical protein
VFANFRGYVRKRLPPSYRAFRRGVSDIVAVVQESRDSATGSLERVDAACRECRSLLEESELGRQQDGLALRELASAVEKAGQRQEVAMKALGRIEMRLDALEQSASTQGRAVNEALWSHVFRDTISSSEWLQDKAFSPGRWAVGYPYLYVLFRVLNEIRPRRVLELGLGQSTRMIAQYAEASDDVRHTVIEHDAEWIDFFSRNYRLPECTRVTRLDWGVASYKEADDVRVYSGFAAALEGAKFDLISIDGPLGGDMKRYARIDVLRLLPDCLASSFVIMLDDYERDGESHTMREMQYALSGAGIDYLSCRYSGSKDLGLLCSTDLAFLCSM